MKGLVGLLYLHNFNWLFIKIQFLVRLFHITTKDLNYNKSEFRSLGGPRLTCSLQGLPSFFGGGLVQVLER